jgi:hypothetical protein
MTAPKVFSVAPILGVGEWGAEQGGGAYIQWLEHVSIPGLEHADVRFEFAEPQTVAQVEALIRQMKKMGLRFVVQR